MHSIRVCCCLSIPFIQCQFPFWHEYGDIYLLQTSLNFFNPFLCHARVFCVKIVRSSTSLKLQNKEDELKSSKISK